MKEESEVNKNICFIQDGKVFFQVLNEDGTDWDEPATKAAYEEWKAS
jgi:hypothetical protein